jgi:hypothetical protein
MSYDLSKLNLSKFIRKFNLSDEYREKMKKDCGAINKDNLLAVMSVLTEKSAQYIFDYEKLTKEYKSAKRFYDTVYSACYDFLKYDPSVEEVLYDPRIHRNDDLLVQAVEVLPEVLDAKKHCDELESECSMMMEYLKAFNQRAWTCKNILELLKFQAGDF